jgi:hypothetical protein
MFGANLIRFERQFDDGFRLDLDRVAAALTPRTRLIIVTNPHNPTGVLTGADDLRALGALAERNDGYILTDEIYLDAVSGAMPAAAATLSPRIITTASLTKAYGLAGLRCGGPWPIHHLRGNPPRADLVDGTVPCSPNAPQPSPLKAWDRLAHAPGDSGRTERFEAFMAGEPEFEWWFRRAEQ